MGTSVRMLDLTYGHLVKGSEDSARLKLDAYPHAQSLGQSSGMSPELTSSP